MKTSHTATKQPAATQSLFFLYFLFSLFFGCLCEADTLISAQMQTLIATDSDIDERKMALLPTTPPASGKKSGELWSTKSSAPLLAAILKAYVCVCMSLSSVRLNSNIGMRLSIFLSVCCHMSLLLASKVQAFFSAAMSAITRRSAVVGITRRHSLLCQQRLIWSSQSRPSLKHNFHYAENLWVQTMQHVVQQVHKN